MGSLQITGQENPIILFMDWNMGTCSPFAWGEWGHEAEGISYGKNLQLAPPAGNKASDCQLEYIFVHVYV